MPFLRSGWARVLTAVLMLQALAFYALAFRPEHIPVTRPLDQFPTTLGGWYSVREDRIDKEILDVLRADDTLSRLYTSGSNLGTASLFIAFFKTQRTGQSPHSPKNCLPGTGWEPTATGYVTFPVPSEPRPITINRYVVSHGNERSVVLYWYQSPNRIIASEYLAKFWLVADSIRYHRSDTSLVRVVVRVQNNDDRAATEVGETFIRSIFPELRKQFPQ